jgi:hypothetical protein
MTLEQALVVWAYMKHQYNPPAEARQVADEAWKVICAEANKIIFPPE